MQFNDISIPEVYNSSWDFRFFLKWIWSALGKLKYDTEHLSDIYDPLKCKEELLWMLGDTIGYRYDDRLPASFNRLVILYFMEMIRKKGSKSGVTFAAEINLAQFNLINYGAGYIDENGEKVDGKDILYNRLEDTSIPVNAVSVTPHTAEGYIEVVYFSTEKPIDACIEYVRPLGMYLFDSAGVRFDARTQISIDARLTNLVELHEGLGSTHVSDYTRFDYASIQKVNPIDRSEWSANSSHVDLDSTDTKRLGSYYRNSDYEGQYDSRINPGYRALYSLQLSNNEHVFKSLLDPIFSLGYHPIQEGETVPDDPYYITEDNVTTINPESYLAPEYQYLDHHPKVYPYLHLKDEPEWNLRYDRDLDMSNTTDITVLDEDTEIGTQTQPMHAVNPVMHQIGDAIALNDCIFTEKLSDTDDITYKYKGEDTEE